MKHSISALALFLAVSVSLSAFGRYSYRPAYFVGDSFTVRVEGGGRVHPELAPEYRVNAFLSVDGALPEPYEGGMVQVKNTLTLSGFGLLLRSLKINGHEIDWRAGERHWSSPRGYSVRVGQSVQRIVPGSISRSIGLLAERYIHAFDVLCYAAIATLFVLSFWHPHLDMAYVYVGFMGTVIGALNSNSTMGALMPLGLPEELVVSEAMLGFASALATTLVALALWLIKLVICPDKTWMWRSQA